MRSLTQKIQFQFYHRQNFKFYSHQDDIPYVQRRKSYIYENCGYNQTISANTRDAFPEAESLEFRNSPDLIKTSLFPSMQKLKRLQIEQNFDLHKPKKGFLAEIPSEALTFVGLKSSQAFSLDLLRDVLKQVCEARSRSLTLEFKSDKPIKYIIRGKKLCRAFQGDLAGLFEAEIQRGKTHSLVSLRHCKQQKTVRLHFKNRK